MKCRLNVIALLSGAMILAAGTAHALSLGTNITVNDGMALSGGWYGAGNTSFAGEDNEVELGNAYGQKWDLEGFFLNGTDLSIVSGYNLYKGQRMRVTNNGVTTSRIIRSGDIFIDLNGDAVYSPNSPSPAPPSNQNRFQISNSYYNYDYVLDIKWAAGTYDVVQLSSTSILNTGVFGTGQNWESSPWRYEEGGTIISSGSFRTYRKASHSGTGFAGDRLNNNHYIATFLGLSFLSEATANIVFHNTMGCGNDNLIGIATAVPEPSTMLLLGSGLLGLAGLNRRKKKS